MAQFVAFDPHAQVKGVGLQVYVAALGEKAREVLQAYGFDRIDPDAWYPQQQFLDALRELAEGDFNASMDMVHVGTKIPEFAPWPPGVHTAEDALVNLNAAYRMHHRGKVGEYQVEQVGERQFVINVRTPYPCDFDYGIIYATARHYLPEGTHLVVEHTEDSCRKNGDDCCTYYVRW